jgi:hypothetical protein
MIRDLLQLAVLVVGLSVVGEHLDALCEVGHDGLSLLLAEVPGFERLEEDLPDAARGGSCRGGQVGDQLVTSPEQGSRDLSATASEPRSRVRLGELCLAKGIVERSHSSRGQPRFALEDSCAQ